MLPIIRPRLKRIHVFSTKSKLFITGYNVLTNKYRVLEVDCLVTLDANNSLILRQDPTEYMYENLEVHLKSLQSKYDNLELICEKAYSIYGFIKLLESYYLIMITKRRKVGIIKGHYIYAIEKTQYIAISPKQRNSKDEIKYRNILTNFDLAKNCYFSFTYDLTNTLQHNIFNTRNNNLDSVKCNGQFLWNSYALKPLMALLSSSLLDSSYNNISDWIVPVIFGFFQQKLIKLDFEGVLRYTLIARRSRHFAGTRYLRRGVNSDGYVANEVESEQIVTREYMHTTPFSKSSSLVQVRGSIPLYWSHSNLLSPRPDINIEPSLSHKSAARRHFRRLYDRYGDHISILSLVRQNENKPRESLLGSAYGEICSSLNEYFKSRSKVCRDNQETDLEFDVTKDVKKSAESLVCPQVLDQQLPDAAGAVGSISAIVTGDITIGTTSTYPESNDSHNTSLLIPLDSLSSSLLLSLPSLPPIIESSTTTTTTSSIAAEEVEGEGESVNNNNINNSSSNSNNNNNNNSYSIPIIYLTYDFLSSMSANPTNTSGAVFSSLDQISQSLQPLSGFFVENISCYSKHKSIEADEYLKFPLRSDDSCNNITDNSTSVTATSLPPPYHNIPLSKAKHSNSSSRFNVYNYSLNNNLDLLFNDDLYHSSNSNTASTGTTNKSNTGTITDANLKNGDYVSDGPYGIINGSQLTHGLLQNGILRTNCIDCLDRTNVAQFCYAKLALVSQLKALGIQLLPSSLFELEKIVMEVWSSHGDAIARQYGGSGAMHRIDGSTTNTTSSNSSNSNSSNMNETPLNIENEFILTSGAKNALVAAQRYYSNVTTDFERQQSYDLLLGIFEPHIREERHIWQLKKRPEDLRDGSTGRRQSDMISNKLMEKVFHDSRRQDEDEFGNGEVTEEDLQESIHESAIIKLHNDGNTVTLPILSPNNPTATATTTRPRMTTGYYSHHNLLLGTGSGGSVAGSGGSDRLLSLKELEECTNEFVDIEPLSWKPFPPSFPLAVLMTLDSLRPLAVPTPGPGPHPSLSLTQPLFEDRAYKSRANLRRMKNSNELDSEALYTHYVHSFTFPISEEDILASSFPLSNDSIEVNYQNNNTMFDNTKINNNSNSNSNNSNNDLTNCDKVITGTTGIAVSKDALGRLSSQGQTKPGLRSEGRRDYEDTITTLTQFPRYKEGYDSDYDEDEDGRAVTSDGRRRSSLTTTSSAKLMNALPSSSKNNRTDHSQGDRRRADTTISNIASSSPSFTATTAVPFSEKCHNSQATPSAKESIGSDGNIETSTQLKSTAVAAVTSVQNALETSRIFQKSFWKRNKKEEDVSTSLVSRTTSSTELKDKVAAVQVPKIESTLSLSLPLPSPSLTPVPSNMTTMNTIKRQSSTDHLTLDIAPPPPPSSSLSSHTLLDSSRIHQHDSTYNDSDEHGETFRNQIGTLSDSNSKKEKESTRDWLLRNTLANKLIGSVVSGVSSTNDNNNEKMTGGPRINNNDSLLLTDPLLVPYIQRKIDEGVAESMQKYEKNLLHDNQQLQKTIEILSMKLDSLLEVSGLL